MRCHASVHSRFRRASRGIAVTTALALMVAAPVAFAAPERTAEELYYEGSARYSAANYTGAIDSFTQALEIVTREGADPAVRGALLLNLAKAHVKAYDVDNEMRHLRAAREVYQRYVNEAEAAEYPESDVADSRRQIDELARLIKAHDDDREVRDQPASGSSPATESTRLMDDGSARQREQRFKAGIALTVVGGVFLAGGMVALGWGTTFKPHAEDQAAQMQGMVDPKDIESYLDQETLKGNVWMGVGATIAVVGLAGLVAGVVLIVKNKKPPPAATALRLGPLLGRTNGLALSGSF